jgi:4-hydroxybenzoyl-CoA thioesterase
VDAPTHMADAPTHVDLAAASGEFRRPRLIRFSDCDPAGIVFYPQYFVMLNGLIEDWVNEGLGLSYHGLVAQRRIGLPTVKLDVDFRAVSRMGAETGEVRMQMTQVIVTTSLDTHRAVAIPDDFRAAILRGAPELR